jgi:nitric oxide reductase subunit B
MASILAFLMIKLNGIDREVVEKWLYVIVGLALFSGILGTGHHYYWIGAPGYWQWIGSLFSTLEVAPFFTMVIFTFVMTWKAGRKHPNRAALLWSIGCSVMAFMAYAIPELRGRAPYNQMLSMVSFWAMCTAMSVMTFALTFAGVVQTHLQRVLGESFMVVQDQLALFYWIRLGSGVVVVISAFMFIWAMLVPGKERRENASGFVQPAE